VNGSIRPEMRARIQRGSIDLLGATAALVVAVGIRLI
jgi:hypothetical protein